MSHKNLLDRIGNETLRNAAAACLDLAASVRERRAALDKDANLTERGRAQAIGDALTKQFAPKFRKAQQPIAAALAEVEKRKLALTLPTPDRTDLAGVLERQEIRAYLRGLPIAERSALVFSSKDQGIVDAVLTAPAELSGIPQDRFEALQNITRERLHGPAMKEIAAAEAVALEAMAVIKVAQNDMRAAAGLDELKFGAIIDNVKQGAPWLIKEGEKIVVAKPGQSTYPEATADDLAAGKYYANKDEYDQDRAA